METPVINLANWERTTETREGSILRDAGINAVTTRTGTYADWRAIEKAIVSEAINSLSDTEWERINSRATRFEVASTAPAAAEKPADTRPVEQRYHFPTTVDRLLRLVNGTPAREALSIPAGQSISETLPEPILGAIARVAITAAGKGDDAAPLENG